MKFQLGRGWTPCSPPFDYAYAPSEENEKGVRKFSVRFLAFSNEISTVQKIVLSSSRGQGNFRGLEASRQGQGLEASRPRPRTSKCVLEDVLEAKDVLEDSTSAIWLVRILTYKNADEKAHTFSRSSKNAKKRTKTDLDTLCKFALSPYRTTTISKTGQHAVNFDINITFCNKSNGKNPQDLQDFNQRVKRNAVATR